jgi:hypothetical protein
MDENVDLPVEPEKNEPEAAPAPAEASSSAPREDEAPSSARELVSSAASSHEAATPTPHPQDPPPKPEKPWSGRLELTPWPRDGEPPKAEAKAPEPPPRRGFAHPIGLAAGIAAVGLLAVGALGLHDHFARADYVAERNEESVALDHKLDVLRTQIETADTARAKDTLTETRRLIGEVKAGATATHDFGAQITQLSQRIDKLEKDQGARLDKVGDVGPKLADLITRVEKLEKRSVAAVGDVAGSFDRAEKDQSARLDKVGERIDRDVTPKLADLVARVDKLEKRSSTPVAATIPPPAPAPSLPPRAPTPQVVANDVTGSTDKPKPVLHGYTVEDIRDGMALIEGREGSFTVAPGDIIPGAGRVLRIERHGRDWMVVTSLGVIMTPTD